MEHKLEQIDLTSLETEKCDNSIIIVTEGKAYLKQLPQYGVVEIHTREGKVVKGDDRTGWKLK